VLDITDVAFGGKAVGRLADGRVCFVEAELQRVLEASPRRVKPPCTYYGACGGCSYQHVAYDYQVELKAKQVRDILRRLGGIDEPNVREGVPSPLPYGYRNRITVHRNGGRIGFHRRDGKGLVDIEACLLASDEVNLRLTELRQERFHEGARVLREHASRMGFHQTNDGVGALLQDAVTEACGSGACLIDAYCGDGFFAHRLAKNFQRVIGLEWNERSIAQARSVAFANESYVEGDVAARLAEVLEEADGDGTTVILDPPSQGLDVQVADLLRAYPVAGIVYVSCNPATLARDLKALAAVYRLESATPFDMFPQTAEIEVLAILRRRAVEEI